MTDEEFLAGYGVDTTPFAHIGLIAATSVTAFGWHLWQYISPYVLDARAPVFVLAAAGASPPFIALGCVVWERIRPLLIPQAQIDALARGYIARYGDNAAYALDIDIDRAQRRCEIAEAGGYRRILHAVERIQGGDCKQG